MPTPPTATGGQINRYISPSLAPVPRSELNGYFVYDVVRGAFVTIRSVSPLRETFSARASGNDSPTSITSVLQVPASHSQL